MLLYRYRPIDKFTLEALIYKKNWASMPVYFNDPFEFNLRSNITIDANGRIKYLNESEEEIRNLIKRSIKNFGVVSYSANEFNILLWSHYSTNHQGLCLVFDVNHSNMTNLYRVEYKNKIAEIEFKNEADFSSLLTTKSKDWEYENEYRQVFKNGNQLYPFPGDLKEIIFGCHASPNDIELVIKTCITHYEKIIFSKMFIQEDTFSLGKEIVHNITDGKIPKVWRNTPSGWDSITP